MNAVLFPLSSNKTPAVPEGTDWRDYRGAVKSKLIGCMVPSGVVVLDVDTYKGATTDDVDKAVGCQLPWDNAELQQTLNGGMHYVFRVPGTMEMSNAQDAMGVSGFDVRAHVKGYIATGEGYTNLTFLDSVIEAIHEREFWPELPLEVALQLCAGDAIGEDDELLAAVAAQPLDMSVDEVKTYLDALSDDTAAEGGSWLTVAMALKHQFGDSNDGWELFDEFSRRCPEKYNERLNRKRWDSLKNDRAKPVTFASVIQMAGGRGVVVEDTFQRLIDNLKRCEKKAEFELLLKDASALNVDGLNAALLIGTVRTKAAELIGQKLTEAQAKKLIKKSAPKLDGAFFDDYIFLTATGEYMHRETKVVMGPRAFDVKHSRETPPDGDGNPQRATVYADSRIACVHCGMYAPMFGEVFTHEGVDYFNTYRPNQLSRVEAGEVAERVKRHVAHLLPDESEQQLLINYLAHNVQHPGVKIQWAIILQGVQGDGKSFFAEMMRHVLGFGNCNIIGAEALDEKYTAFAEGRCMVFIEELKLDNYRKYETINKLKPYITNTVVSVRKMYQDTYEALNTTNYIALTNFKDALPIDDSDRRYCVLFSQWQGREALEAFIKEHPTYYPDLYEAMRQAPGEILDWLMSIKIPDSFYAAKRAPATAAKVMMQDLHRGDDWDAVADAIDKFRCVDINEHVINVSKLTALATGAFEDFPDFPGKNRLAHLLHDMGYTNCSRVTFDGKRCRFYSKSGGAAYIANLLKEDSDRIPF